MNQPVDTRQVKFYAVAAPGVDPSSVHIQPEVQVLGWKFAEYEKGDLIDIVKLVDQHVSALTKWCEAAKGTLKQTLEHPTAEKPEIVVPGKQFEAHYIRSLRIDVDRDKVKAHFGEERYAKEFCKQTEVYMLKIVPIAQTPGTAVPAA